MFRIRIIIFFAFLMIAQSVGAQAGLMIQGTSPDLHLLHTVAAKETWFSIGRMYNLAPREIAVYNHLTIDKPLGIGQSVKVPLRAANFSQNDAKAANEVFVPVYHTIQEKEWLYRVSVNHNKVPVEKLEKWNNINKDQAKAGMRLIVGYLKVKAENASLATNADSQPPVVTDPAVNAQVQKENSPVKKEESKPVTKTEDPTEVALSGNAKQVVSINDKAGYFREQYENSGKSASGVSGIFKSTSGWNDGKYYALMNNIPVGTIVKVSFPASNKAIYAKVLGQLPEMKESFGLTIRISDAAANELGTANDKFLVDVKY